MFIRSERLFLRPYWPEDRPELLALAGAEHARLPAMAGWPEAGGALFAHEPEDRRCPRFLVTLPNAQGSRIVGFVGLARVGEQVETGLWIAPDYRGRGYGWEAGRAMLSVAQTLGLRAVSARVEPGNRSGSHLLQKLCFERSGDQLVRRLGETCRGGDAHRARAAA